MNEMVKPPENVHYFEICNVSKIKFKALFGHPLAKNFLGWATMLTDSFKCFIQKLDMPLNHIQAWTNCQLYTNWARLGMQNLWG